MSDSGAAVGTIELCIPCRRESRTFMSDEACMSERNCSMKLPSRANDCTVSIDWIAQASEEVALSIFPRIRLDMLFMYRAKLVKSIAASGVESIMNPESCPDDIAIDTHPPAIVNIDCTPLESK